MSDRDDDESTPALLKRLRRTQATWNATLDRCDMAMREVHHLVLRISNGEILAVRAELGKDGFRLLVEVMANYSWAAYNVRKLGLLEVEGEELLAEGEENQES